MTVEGRSVALTFALVLASAAHALAYSPCEDASVADQTIANPLKSDSAPLTLVCNAELATVSDDSAVVTWVTNKIAPSQVDCWALDGSDCSASGADGIYHAVEIRGLVPGTIYYYRIVSDIPALPTLQSPGVFRTFDRPGDYLFSFASLNDMHVGETVSGQLTSLGGNPIPPSFRQDDPPYWEVMNAGSVAAIQARGAAFTIVKGDLTSDGTQTAQAAALLAPLANVFAIRGNHDKSLGAFLSGIFDPRGRPLITAVNDHASDADPHLDFSFAAPVTGSNLSFVALDSWDNDKPLPPPSPLEPPNAVGGGRVTADQLEWLDHELARGKPTFVYMHHPVSELAAVTAIPPIIFTVREPDAALFLQKIAAHPNVVGVLSGHTHRNWITQSLLAPGVPFVETAAAKEYPGGYAIYKVFSGGYIQSFHKCTTPQCLAWSEKTRGEYLNLYPLYTSQTGARNGSFAYEFATRKITSAEVR
jgi:3',5'-cyclic-AMP phosphodiesterase